MKGMSGQYMNELVSLTILALMVAALIAGQASVSEASAAQVEVRPETPALTANIDVVIDAVSIRAHLGLTRGTD